MARAGSRLAIIMHNRAIDIAVENQLRGCWSVAVAARRLLALAWISTEQN